MSDTTASMQRQERRHTPDAWAALRHRAADWTSTDYSQCRWNNRGDVEGLIRSTSPRPGSSWRPNDPYRHAAKIRPRVGSIPHAGICQPTVAGLDGLPAWFLRVAAPIFCKTIAYLFSMSLTTSAVPRQWKETKIRPLYLTKYQQPSNTLTTDQSLSQQSCSD